MDYVYWDEDRDLMITCCGDDHDFSDARQVRVVGLGHLVNRDPTLRDIPELELGEWAERSDEDRRWHLGRRG